MAAEFVTTAAANAVGNLATEYASRYLSYFFRFGKIVEDFKIQRKKLELKKDLLKNDIDEAKQQTEVIEKDVEEWLTEAEKELGEAQSLEDEIERNKCFNCCPSWGWRYSLSIKVRKKTLCISTLLETCNFQRIGRRPPLQGIDFMPSESSTLAFNGIMKALKSDGVNMIGLYGMPGVGKTTLAVEAGKQALEQKLFDKVMIVTVSQNPDINIRERIAELFGLEFKSITEQGKAEELWWRLKGEKKILIILDDVWKKLKLQNIGIQFGREHEGCKILLTTRLQQVCSEMDCQEEFKLNIQSDDEAWALFKDKAGLNDGSRTFNVAKEVAHECEGLPLAIVTVANALKDENLNGWMVANQRLKDPRHSDNQDVFRDIYAILELSYDYLDQDDIKQCFLLCSLFPEDYEISIELLITFGIGQGLFNNNYVIEDSRKEICQALLKLQQSGLLVETDDENFVKMHKVVRKFAHWITSRGENMFMVKNGLRKWPLNASFSCYTAISLWNNKIVNFPENIEFSKLRTLLLAEKQSLQVSSKFFAGMKALQVLLLQDVIFSLEALQFLTKLRTLCLIDCKLENISSLRNMKNLENFALLNTNIHELPEELVELHGLKSLYFSCIGPSNVPPNLLSRLTSLQDLHVTNENNVNLLELNSVSRLTGLTLRVSTDQCFQENCVFPKRRDNIVVEFENMEGLPSGTLRISDLFCNVKSLTLIDINMKHKNSFSRCLAQSVMHAEQLRISTYSKLDQVFAFAKEMAEQEVPPLSNLTCLELKSLPELSCIWRGPTHFVSLRLLKTMKIQWCTKVVYLFSPILAQTLVHLEELDIQGCDSLNLIIEVENSDEVVSNMDSNLLWERLRSLRIARCKSLEYVFPITLAQGLPKLESLGVIDCPRLKHVFGMAKKKNGPEAKEMDMDEANETDRHDIELPQLKDLRLENLERLRSFCPKNYFVETYFWLFVPILLLINQQGQGFIGFIEIFSMMSRITIHTLREANTFADSLAKFGVERQDVFFAR
ncbi:Cc-nbs-lrr resistance protein, putative [Theobroma cacao]|uniref:Cc-nbs-lrr resistance protein, putative n=1 Tax=Theobroma cacao TaxID=3641 RepID=A0A061F4Y4_THECC|nr:Cc-nbs-lrr resistance protein, putative [Theobroma cacao]